MHIYMEQVKDPCVEGREQGVGSLLPCVSQGLNSDWSASAARAFTG